LAATDLVPGPFPVVTASKTETGKHAAWNVGAGSLTIASHGAYAGHVNYWPTPIWLANNVFLISPGTNLAAKFLYYFLKSNEHHIQALAKGGGVPYFNARDVASFLVPIPYANDREKSLAAQHEVVRILDSFDALINPTEQGLPRETALRQQQYAYYRDQLLSFRKLEEVAS
jgi:type I restriction enzyme S subunit